MKLRKLAVAMIGVWGAAACSNAGGASDAGSDAIANDVNAPDVKASEAGSDAGADASDAGCPYVYCDDFESYDAGSIANNALLGPWKASVSGNGVQFGVDAVKPYGGKQSLHVTVPTNAGEDAGTATRSTLNQNADAGVVAGNDVFGRAMVYYSSAGGNGLPLGVHSWIFNASGFSTAADGGVTMNMGGGGMKLQLNYHPPAPLAEQSVQGGAITAGAWHCVQWEYKPDDTAKVWIDGTVAVNVPTTQGWNFATPWKSFDFGFTHYQALANGVDVYLDDFALDGAMIPCPP